MNEYLYTNVIEDHRNSSFINAVRLYANRVERQVYILNKPLTDLKYSYDFKDGLILLEASKKICFINLGSDNGGFEDYCNDVLADLYSISDSYSFKDIVGRTRTWESLLSHVSLQEIGDIEVFMQSLSLADTKERRKQEVLLSMFIGSINDIGKIGTLDIPESLLDKVKRKIQLFDTQQTRFIYQELSAENKRITIQGMSGTGKTELLLHKCKDLYTIDTNNVIGFTCFNRVLSSELQHRIPEFFDRMNATKQINPKRLMIVRAWGSYGDEYSGIYRYICFFYGIPFYSYKECRSFDSACKMAIDAIKSKRRKDPEYKQKYAYTYLFIDESQDFSKSFFDLCELATQKNLFVAGDIFQSIFESRHLNEMQPNFLLSNCYRTDPKTFMFAHALGLGLFESHKLRWLQKNEWELCGYKVEDTIKTGKAAYMLRREPIRRFEDMDANYDSLKIISSNSYQEYIILEINKLREEYPTISPDDIAIIYIDITEEDYIYSEAPEMQLRIQKELGWNANLAYETKDRKPDEVFISNKNNVKGLEFPFVFCISRKISRLPQYRNILYTVLTRSFLRSYLLLPNTVNNGLSDEMLDGGREIMEGHRMTVIVPTEKEQQEMEKWLLDVKQVKSLDERLDEIMHKKGISDMECKKKIKENFASMLSSDTTDEDLSRIVELVSKNLKV